MGCMFPYCEGKEFNKVENSCNSFFDVVADDDDVSLLLLLIKFPIKKGDEIDLSRQKFQYKRISFPPLISVSPASD